MTHQNCLFCSIIAKTIPSTIIAQNDELIVIKDIAPQAQVHYLIITKKHIKDVQGLHQADAQLAGNMLLMANELSQSLAGSKSFQLVVNNGAQAGQQVFHLHMHFLSNNR